MTQKKIIREYLMASNYRLYDTTTSKIDPRVTTTKEVGFICPLCRCEDRGQLLEHGEERQCLSCGLAMITWGNGLDCWITDRRLQEYREAGHEAD